MDHQESLSEADQIRLKRVAKLQQQAEEQKRRAQQEQTSLPLSSSTEKPNLQPLPSLEESLVPKATLQKSSSVKPAVAPSTPPAPVATPNKPSSPSITSPTSSPSSQSIATVKPAKSFEDWQNDVISRILQITLNPEAIYKQGRCVYLQELARELNEENVPNPHKLTRELLDRALVARLSLDPNESHDELPQDITKDLSVPHFDYLLNCWKQAHDIRKNTVTRSKNLDKKVLDERLSVLDDIKALIISYSGLILQMPDMFPQSVNGGPYGPEQLIPRLMAEPDSTQGLPVHYLSELVARFEDDGLDVILGPALETISKNIAQCNILDDFKPYLQSLMLLCENKSVAAALPSMPRFDPADATPRNLEDVSLLGPFYKLSGYPDSAPKVAERSFQNSETRNDADIEFSKTGLRGSVNNLQRSLFGMTNNIVRSSPKAREHMLSYFAHILRLNDKRAQMQVDPTTVASDGFMHNITAVLLDFCEPFLDVRASKIDKIDPHYFRTSHRIDVMETTKINATKEQSDEYYKDQSSTSSHSFITEIFYLTLTFLHYGPIRSFVNYNEFMREYSELKKQCTRYEEEASRLANTPQGMMQDFVAKRLKAKLDLMTTHKLALESMLMDPQLLTHIMRFYNLVMAWLIRMVDPNGRHPWEMVKLPLSKDIPEAFAMLPEWIVEDITEFFIFVGKFGYETQVMRQNPHDELVIFIITFLRNTNYIKNPYLKAKFVEILFFFTFPIAKGVPGELENMLNSHPLALAHLVPSLMIFYVEVEQTGASSQFYDKFNIRYNISHVMKTIWNHPTHRAKLREESQNQELFTRFVNMLMSDVTYLLDESLSKLSEIHQIQTEMDDAAAWAAQPQQQRQEREGTLVSLERQAQSYVALGNETVRMLKYLTSEVVMPFLVNEIVDRLAAMLDYNLSQLVGPKCTELKVKNREKYHFRPRTLLSDIIDIYLNLNTTTFIEAVARDGRSYRKEYFSKAASILSKHGLKHQDHIAALEQFVNRVEEAIKLGVEEEEELGDVPDEYLDPIFFTLMEDPVLLPTSGVIVDRSTIRAHLLGDTRDPFNRAPLSMEMVEPATELQEKIREWKAQQKQKKQDTMDTSD